MRISALRDPLRTALLFFGIALLVAVQNHQGASTSLPPGQTPSFLVFLQIEMLVWGMWWLLLPWMRLGLEKLRGLRTHRSWLWALALFGFGLFTCLLWALGVALFQFYVWTPRPAEDPVLVLVTDTFRFRLVSVFLIYACVAGAFESLHLIRQERARALRESALRADLAEARLDSLRARLQPHFLFNSLNAVASLMGRDVPAARSALAHLSQLLRGALEDAPEDAEIPLQEELELLDHYFELLRLRFSDRLHLEIQVDETRAQEALVPRLSLQPLVENAVVHGIERRQSAGWIRVTARISGERLLVLVEDDGPGPPAPPIREGIGLGATRARLETLYPEASELHLSRRPEGGARVEMVIPLEPRQE